MCRLQTSVKRVGPFEYPSISQYPGEHYAAKCTWHFGKRNIVVRYCYHVRPFERDILIHNIYGHVQGGPKSIWNHLLAAILKYFMG